MYYFKALIFIWSYYTVFFCVCVVIFFIVKLEFTLCHLLHLVFIAFSGDTHCRACSTPPVSTSAFITAVCWSLTALVHNSCLMSVYFECLSHTHFLGCQYLLYWNALLTLAWFFFTATCSHYSLKWFTVVVNFESMITFTCQTITIVVIVAIILKHYTPLQICTQQSCSFYWTLLALCAHYAKG